MTKVKKNTTLFNQLMKIADNQGTRFFYKDFISQMGTKVRVFSYHIANYTDWLEKGALESRGILFELDANDKPVRIMCRPMAKFFNVNENPFTMDLDFSKALYFMTKEDGSLISTFQDKGSLFLKSKTSLFSDQVHMAFTWLNTHPYLKARLLELANLDYTVNMEYVGPDNRIVLGYETSFMRILNVRHNATGDYVGMDELYADPVLRQYMVEVFDSIDCANPDWISKVRKMEGIEGYIIALEDMFVKLKTDWYCALHHTKDSINSNKQLAMVCVNNAVDDLVAMFPDDKPALTKIVYFEDKYRNTLTDYFTNIKLFVESNHQLDRRDYAINGQKFVAENRIQPAFSVIMKMYQTGFDGEQCIKSINQLFEKNTDLIVPDEYK